MVVSGPCAPVGRLCLQTVTSPASYEEPKHHRKERKFQAALLHLLASLAILPIAPYSTYYSGLPVSLPTSNPDSPGQCQSVHTPQFCLCLPHHQQAPSTGQLRLPPAPTASRRSTRNTDTHVFKQLKRYKSKERTRLTARPSLDLPNTPSPTASTSHEHGRTLRSLTRTILFFLLHSSSRPGSGKQPSYADFRRFIHLRHPHTDYIPFSVLPL